MNERIGVTVWPHYSILKCEPGGGMNLLREIFGDGEADAMNFCLLSTSGVHGTYRTIEDAEKHLRQPTEDSYGDVTFVVVHPRLVCLRWGNCQPETQNDIDFLKKLRASSAAAVVTVGMPK